MIEHLTTSQDMKPRPTGFGHFRLEHIYRYIYIIRMYVYIYIYILMGYARVTHMQSPVIFLISIWFDAIQCL